MNKLFIGIAVAFFIGGGLAGLERLFHPRPCSEVNAFYSGERIICDGVTFTGPMGAEIKGAGKCRREPIAIPAGRPDCPVLPMTR